MKRLAILGSTGSIGTSTLRVVQHLGSEQCEVVALAAHSNITALHEQIKQFRPKLVAVFDEAKALELQKQVQGQCEVVSGRQGLLACAAHPDVNFVMSALSGAAGLEPTLAAIEQGCDIGLANKEVLVAAGELIMNRVALKGVRLIPVDSEHSALFQCLQGQDSLSVRRLILTASGGPFRHFSAGELENVTINQALKHPNWTMGAKVTIDSSTLMNKGLEVIEAHHLFGVAIDHIEVVIHPQSIIHSMVEFDDTSIMAQMGLPDMMLPIQYALTYPRRFPTSLAPMDFTKGWNLEFSLPDTQRFPCLRFAYDALKVGKTAPCFLNAANEVLVSRFLNKEIGWSEIAKRLDCLMNSFEPLPASTLESIMAVDYEARDRARLI